MPLGPEEKARRARQRMLDKAAEYQLGTYVRKFVSPVFQLMIRAEAGCVTARFAPAIVCGRLVMIQRKRGQVVCVTCGAVGPWKGRLNFSGFHTGHFLASRRNSILFEEDNVAPQCANCNRYLNGNPQNYRLWMEAVRPASIPRLEDLKRQTREFTREELVDMLISYRARLKAAEELMAAYQEGEGDE